MKSKNAMNNRFGALHSAATRLRVRQKAIETMRTLFDAATSVTCDKCGAELKGHQNLDRLSRFGCNHCGCHRFTYHDLPEAVSHEAIEAMEGVRLNE